MRNKFILLLFFLLNGIIYLQANNSDKQILGSYSFNGTLKDQAGVSPAAQIKSPTFIPGKNKSEKSIEFSKMEKLTIPIDLKPSKYPKVTITAWIKLYRINREHNVILCGNADKNRGIRIVKDGDGYFWAAGGGGDDNILGNPVKSEWTFIAVLYDNENQEARLIVNNNIYAGRSSNSSKGENIYIGGFDGAVAEVNIFKGLLSLDELREVSDLKIAETPDKLEIKDRYTYKKDRRKKEIESFQINSQWIVATERINLYDTSKSNTAIDFISEGDTITILGINYPWVKIKYYDTKEGFVRFASLPEGTYEIGASGFWHSVKITFKNLFNIGRTKSWIIFIIVLVLLILAFKYYDKIDSLFIKLGGDAELTSSGSMEEGVKVSVRKKMMKYFPHKRFHRWPIMIGITAAALIIIGSFWNSYELEWFFNEGFNLLPVGYDRTIHRFLYITVLFILFLFIAMIVESYALAGIKGGIPRVIYLTIINIMSLMVTFFLFIVIAIIVIIIIGLSIFGAALGGGGRGRLGSRYIRCSYCNYEFLNTNYDRCPNCGQYHNNY